MESDVRPFEGYKGTLRYNGTLLRLSNHAKDRLRERFNCTDEELEAKAQEILDKGFEQDFQTISHPVHGIQKERTVSYQDMTLHIRENTIATVKYNMAFYGSVKSKRGRTFRKSGRFSH